MLNLIVAPASVDKKAVHYAKKIVKFLKAEKCEYSVYFSTNLEDVNKNLNELYLLGETEYVVIGGDVVLNQFINGIKDLTKIKLGIIPTSCGDDFANYLGLETAPIQAVKNILNKRIEEVDFLLVNDKKALNNIIIGSSVEAYEQFTQFKWQTFITEMFAKVKIKNKYTGTNLTISTKVGKARTEEIYELVIANGGYSKGKHISPLSNVKDGLFNLLYSNSTNSKKDNKIVKSYSTGKHIYNEKVNQLWLNNVKITNEDNKIKALVDGRILNFDKLEVTVIEKGLKIYK